MRGNKVGISNRTFAFNVETGFPYQDFGLACQQNIMELNILIWFLNVSNMHENLAGEIHQELHQFLSDGNTLITFYRGSADFGFSCIPNEDKQRLYTDKFEGRESTFLSTPENEHLHFFKKRKFKYTDTIYVPKGESFKPVLKAFKSDRGLVLWWRYNGGLVVLIPHYANCYKDLKTIIDQVQNLKNHLEFNVTLPDWLANKYLLGQEEKLRDRLKEIEEIEFQLRKEKEQINRETERYEKLKACLCSSGPELESFVCEILEDLGIKTTRGEKSEGDILLEYDELRGIAEVKGLKKSGKKSNDQQLSGWKVTYNERTETEHKGFLILNTYRDEELSNRTEVDYPDSMLELMKINETCGLTCVQLLNIHQYCEKHPDKKDELIRGVFSFNGHYEDFRDYSQSLTKIQ